jgi:gliding motility-associated-like protein
VKIFLFAICILFFLNVRGQTCAGSLGDPVIKQDFGSGANPGPPLGSAFTNYQFLSADCPNDGYYTIANRTNNCFGNSWHSINQDHTGNPNGYMMIVNASNDPGVFYVQKTNAGQLCPNTTYEFAAWITNLILPSACGGASIQPNITFSIETTSGVVLKTYNTGNIPPTSNVQWQQYGTFFTTPANVTDVIVKMVNNATGGCGNDLALDDITFRPCGPVIQTGFGSAITSADRQLCQGNNATYTLKSQVAGNNSPAYQWQSNNNGSGWVDIAGKNADSLTVNILNAVPGIYQYRLGVANGSNISSVQCRVYSSPLNVNVNPLPVVAPIAPQTVCEGYTLTLKASGGASYIWSGPNMANTTQNPLVINNVTPANAGSYTVQVMSASGCSAAPVQATVKVVPKVVAVVSGPATVCAGQSTSLSASGGLYYKWTPSTGLDHDDTPNPVATPLQTTTYSVNISNDGCNDDTKSIKVTVLQPPFASAGSNKVIFEGQSVKLNGSIKGDSIISIYWTPTTGLDNPASLTPIASPTDDITYTLNITSKSCGTAASPVFVRVYKKIKVPNTFSPNNDGVNDYWNIEALITYPASLLTVYDRYGQKVYQSTGYTKPWDGTNNGKPLPDGTYYYVIDLKNKTPKIAGWVLVVR